MVIHIVINFVFNIKTNSEIYAHILYVLYWEEKKITESVFFPLAIKVTIIGMAM